MHEEGAVLVAPASDSPPGRGDPVRTFLRVPPRGGARGQHGNQYHHGVPGFHCPLPRQSARSDRRDWAHDPRLHDGLRRHLRPPRRTALLLGAYRSGSVPDRTRPGVSLLGLVGKLSRTILAIGRATGKPFGDPVVALLAVSVGLTGPGILLGIGSHTLMGHYALMLKKHAKRIWRRWRKSRRPTNRSSKS